MSFESALSFFIAVCIFGITPGPGVFAILSKALSSGARSCFFLAVGMIISDIIYLVAACFGLAAIATNWFGFFMVVRLAGGAYLLYLGWRLWTVPVVIDPKQDARSNQKYGLDFLQGFLISVSNPKVILFYIAFLPTFFDLTVFSPKDIGLASMLTFVALLSGLMLIAKSAAAARAFFQSPRGLRSLNRTAGSIMVAAGTFLIVSH